MTGASGFIGTYVCHYLLSKGYDVVGLKRDSSDLSTHELIFTELGATEKVRWKTADILDPNGVMEACEACDMVVHSAASVSFQPRERTAILTNNIEGTNNVVNACIKSGIKRLVHISSVAALPNPDKKKQLDESFLNSTYFEFETTYGESKYRSEMEVWRGLGEGLDVTILNPGIVLGRWKFRNSSVEMFRSVFNGLKFYSSGYTGFVHVQDIAHAAGFCLEKPESIGERYILVGDNWYYKDFLFKIADELSVKKPPIRAGLGLSEFVGLVSETWAKLTGSKAFITREIAQSANRHIEFVNQKAQEQLGLSFTPLEEAIVETAAFFKAHPELR